MPALPNTALDSRPFNFALAFGLPLLAMLVLLLGDPSQLDFALSRLFYEPGSGFVGRHSWLLEDVLHDRVKQLVILLAVLALVGFVLSLLPTRLAAWRRPLGCLVLSLALSTSIVTPLKALTGVHCPWSLTDFGGSETYTPLLSERAPTLKPGRCWPGGHASAGFSLLALFFVLRDRHPRAARYALAFALTLGIVLSVGRVMQGAHFMSHNVWTLLFDWLIGTACYRLVLYRRVASPALAPAIDAAR
ncbi:phosphatase PAP2 family protein [Stutzerimonas stutzeri]|uniref:phosphatase PAP2 family protein n=1 Tax=Stutzerimonas stutzeri TaxID=316 RepID=UPI000C9AC709|nr:phosphatase PAP2 family protein [Stutzerimonas stutzeri]PNG12704.1 phosphoesterase [Stutzerimonas stutzeri]